MLHLPASRRPEGFRIQLLALIFLLALGGCNKQDASLIGTFRMGEKVQAGPVTYTVLQAEWKPELEGGKTPTHRFLFIRLSMTNSSGKTVSVPGFTLQGANGQTYEEVSEGLGSTANWLGMLRNLEPGQTQTGYAIFDAPVGAFQLMLSDAGEVGSEKYAQVEIPVQLD